MLKKLSLAILASLSVLTASAQAMFFSSAKTPDPTENKANVMPLDSAARVTQYFEEVFENMDSVTYDTVMVIAPLPDVFFLPAVYNQFEFTDTVHPFRPDYSGLPEMKWIEEQNAQARTMKSMQRYLFFNKPEYVKYNINLLPEAPKVFHAVVNPEDHTIEIKEGPKVTAAAKTIDSAPVKKRHWIRTFNAGLQFSQAYVSPNWYQGGNSNLNMLATIYYNVKLNQAYHENLLFETTAEYKLGMNSAPDDSIHNYSISQDILQINTTFGVKAARKWYYSFTGRFKTQLFNGYPKNSNTLRSAFLSPAELTVGVGMTYNYASKNKKFTFDASIAPVSYNMKICENSKVNSVSYGVPEGKKVKHDFGSSAELKMYWKIAYNIVYTSRLFAFTDYESFQTDWEHRITFDINRYLSTQITANLRYDTETPACDDPDWKKLQVKEIISVGFSYKFSSI